MAIINKGEIAAIDTPENLTTGLKKSITVTVKVGERADEAATLVEKIPRVRVVSLMEGAGLKIETDQEIDVRPEIARVIVGARIDLLEMTRREMSLEDIFMPLITQEDEQHA